MEGLSPEIYRTTAICIDSYENKILNGRLYNPYFDNGICFHSTMDLLKKLDYVLTQTDMSQAFTEHKVFQPVQPVTAGTPLRNVLQKGKEATFVLHILFRQNVSWQGILKWTEGKREESFRSVLELLLLIDSVLDHSGKGGECSEG